MINAITKFEVGKEYATLGGGVAVVSEIFDDQLWGRLCNSLREGWLPVNWKLNGKHYKDDPTAIDLILPVSSELYIIVNEDDSVAYGPFEADEDIFAAYDRSFIRHLLPLPPLNKV